MFNAKLSFKEPFKPFGRWACAGSEPPHTSERVTEFLFRHVAQLCMYDSTNPLVVLFAPEFSSALQCTAVHVLDLLSFYDSLCEEVVVSVDDASLRVFPPFWSGPEATVLKAYASTRVSTALEYVHLYVRPGKALLEFALQCCGGKLTFSRGRDRLKILRLVRLVLRYAADRNLVLPGSFRDSIYVADSALQAALGVRYFHAMDVPVLVYHDAASSGGLGSSCL